MATVTTPVTLAEAARTGQLTERDATLYEAFMSPLSTRQGMGLTFLDVFPWKNVSGLSYEFQRELGLPTITPRGVNQTVTRSVGSTETVTEALKVYPAEYIIDEAIMRTPAGRLAFATQARLHVKALMNTVMNHVFKGDSNSSAYQLDGLQSRAVGDQLVSEGSTSGGDPLQIANLRLSIDRCNGSNKVIFCGKGLSRRFDAALGLSAIGGAVQIADTQFGAKAKVFDGIPIIPVADLDGGDNILGFTEAGAGGGTTATSLYVCALGDDGLMGLRNGGWLDGQTNLPDSVAQATLGRMLYLPGIAMLNSKCMVRHYGISDAAIIA